jgi:hypothetical protein
VDINAKHVIFEIRKKKHLFLDISSTNTDTLVAWLYQCVRTGSTKVFWLLFQPLLRLHFNLFAITVTFAMILDPTVKRFTRQTLPS